MKSASKQNIIKFQLKKKKVQDPKKSLADDHIAIHILGWMYQKMKKKIRFMVCILFAKLFEPKINKNSFTQFDIYRHFKCKFLFLWNKGKCCLYIVKKNVLW